MEVPNYQEVLKSTNDRYVINEDQKDMKLKKHTIATVSLLLATLGWQTSARADTLGASMGIFIYPAENQTPEQQSKDDLDCFNFAKSQTGYDPMNPPEATAAAPSQGPSGQRVRGAARGAAAGAVIGEVVDDDAGKGAAVGATLGVMRGGQKGRQQSAQQSQQADQAAQQQMASMQTGFQNAYGACIEARGYTAKY